MIRPALRQQIRSLYLQGYLARDIKRLLGIDGCIYNLAFHNAWDTKERKLNYNKRRYQQSLCKE